MGNLFTKEVGNLLTRTMGNILTAILGKVLDIYIPPKRSGGHMERPRRS